MSSASSRDPERLQEEGARQHRAQVQCAPSQQPLLHVYIKIGASRPHEELRPSMACKRRCPGPASRSSQTLARLRERHPEGQEQRVLDPQTCAPELHSLKMREGRRMDAKAAYTILSKLAWARHPEVDWSGVTVPVFKPLCPLALAQALPSLAGRRGSSLLTICIIHVIQPVPSCSSSERTPYAKYPGLAFCSFPPSRPALAHTEGQALPAACIKAWPNRTIPMRTSPCPRRHAKTTGDGERS
ncbi:hypothetical protein GLOTRDRAFT_132494 [Gloeophyllum trabeum ATCC 11539]|uniref:Uncharacterized protein n=1 Tax=Gloeophyllum trabeum (strain ATCC 11539 / FP-39264 / Madison 617) TaxID=670483 RepID=S7PYF3_GLOTA|nr:uncharacterized protein GLOTRDRAFT_132494 [Gloeophyllum trabeum ATCC 11539]EPQ52382.1 hypothetical protein GLOTRDRAFT_132494 [Gloeophyllum trabeum ATCC 11539]